MSITVIRVWIRCEECGCTWREKPAAYLLRRLIGRPFGRFTRHSHSGHVTKPAEEVPPRGRALTPPLAADALEQWFDGCDREFGPHAHVSRSVAEWLESDPLGAPAESPARRDQPWVRPPRPTLQGTFVERLDSLHDGLVKLETFVLKCAHEEEATARRLEPPREPDEPRDGHVLPWLPKRGKTTAA